MKYKPYIDYSYSKQIYEVRDSDNQRHSFRSGDEASLFYNLHHKMYDQYQLGLQLVANATNKSTAPKEI